MSSAKGVGIPVKLMHEAEGHVVTVRSLVQAASTLQQAFNRPSCALQVELKGGESYRGELHEAEDNWNCQLKNVTATAKASGCAVSTVTGWV